MSFKKRWTVPFAFAATLSLVGCGDDSPDTESQEDSHVDHRVEHAAEINRYTDLYTVKDDLFECSIVLNSRWNDAGAGVDCALTEQGKESRVDNETIRINRYTELHVVNTERGPSFVVVNSRWNDTAPAVSHP